MIIALGNLIALQKEIPSTCSHNWVIIHFIFSWTWPVRVLLIILFWCKSLDACMWSVSIAFCWDDWWSFRRHMNFMPFFFHNSLSAEYQYWVRIPVLFVWVWKKKNSNNVYSLETNIYASDNLSSIKADATMKGTWLILLSTPSNFHFHFARESLTDFC